MRDLGARRHQHAAAGDCAVDVRAEGR
jgi:hypothetical protein